MYDCSFQHPPLTYKFTGKERDSESGLDNFGARYDSSSLGRFMSPDWSAVVAPVPYANYSDPQSLNLYTYVRNNPLSLRDLDGHNWFTDFFKHAWERNVNEWKYGEAVTNAELPAAFARERQWLIRNVAHNSDEANALAGASNSQINGLFQKWDAAIMAAQGGEVIYGAYQYQRAANGGLVFYRGGGSLEAGPNDIKLDPEGMVKTTHGPSLNTDPAKLERFGEVYEIKLIPPELQIIQRGMNASHYEIVPRQPMTLERFQQLLRSVVTKLVETPEE
jgi:RHS repeat-associated protein